MSNTQPDDLSDVLRFVGDSDDSFWSTECEVRTSPNGGLGVFAKQDLEEGTVLLKLPKSCLFSASNSSIANLLVDDEIDGVLALNIAFLYETTVFKEKSHWFPYLKSIKIYNDDGLLVLPPSHWSETEKLLLKGSTLDTLHGGLAKDEDVQEGFEIAIDLAHKWNGEFGLPIPQGFLDVDLSDKQEVLLKFHRFVATAYALSSRIFEIDAFHESALVPIADLFNHHVTTPDVHFSSLYDVCQLCGEPGMCKHLVAEAALEAAQQDLSEQEMDESSDEDEDNDDDESKQDELVDMTLVHAVKKGQEVFNSYGDLSNALLLARYGFTVAHNPNDVLHLGKEIRQLARHQRHAQRIAWWRKIGYPLWFRSTHKQETEPDEELEQELPLWLSEMCIDSEGSPAEALVAFLNLLSMSELQWKRLYDTSKIQALNKMGDAGVRTFLLRLLAYKGLSLQLPKPDTPDTIKSLLNSERRILQKAKYLQTQPHN